MLDSLCLTALLRKYNQVVQRYFVQYLAGYDAVLLNQLIQVLSAESMCYEYKYMLY